jgi:hypothetical protein
VCRMVNPSVGGALRLQLACSDACSGPATCPQLYPRRVLFLPWHVDEEQGQRLLVPNATSTASTRFL